MEEGEVSSTVAKNLAVSMLLLLLQSFYTFTIVAEWLADLQDSYAAHQVFKEEDSVMLLRDRASVNQTADLSAFGFGDVDLARQFKENLIESPAASTVAVNGILKFFLLFIILSETQGDAVQKCVLFVHSLKSKRRDDCLSRFF